MIYSQLKNTVSCCKNNVTVKLFSWSRQTIVCPIPHPVDIKITPMWFLFSFKLVWLMDAVTLFHLHTILAKKLLQQFAQNYIPPQTPSTPLFLLSYQRRQLMLGTVSHAQIHHRYSLKWTHIVNINRILNWGVHSNWSEPGFDLHQPQTLQQKSLGKLSGPETTITISFSSSWKLAELQRATFYGWKQLSTEQGEHWDIPELCGFNPHQAIHWPTEQLKEHCVSWDF